MAKPPLPHRRAAPIATARTSTTRRPAAGRTIARSRADKLVKTHCCFCGQQCGIQLKVRDNQVVGFEPWEEFPFNAGMLCPKGVKRYLQGGHPDRLLDPLMRTDGGFRKARWDEALDFTARRLREIQDQHGPDAVAVYGGASLTTEKAYLLGKFARVALGTRHIDYNGRLCMVSAGTAYKLAFGVDRSPNPVGRHPEGAGRPRRRREHRRVRADHDRLPLADARQRRQADRRRSAHDADHAQRRSLPARAARHRPGAAARHAARHPARRARGSRRSSTRHTTGFDAVARVRRATGTRDARGRGDRRAARAIEKAAHWFGDAPSARWRCTRAASSTSRRASRTASPLINLCLATGNIGREGAGCMMITGQGNGQGGREHGQKCDQLPGAALDHRSRGARARRARSGASRPSEIPARGLSRRGDHGGHPPRRDQGAALDLLQPAGLAARRRLHARGAGEARVLRRHRFLPLARPRTTPTSCSPAACRRRTKASSAAPKGASSTSARRSTRPANARVDCAIYLRPRAPPRQGRVLPLPRPRARSSTSCARRRAAASPTTTASPTRRSSSEMGVFWPCPIARSSRHAAALRGRPLLPPDGKARFMVAE